MVHLPNQFAGPTSQCSLRLTLRQGYERRLPFSVSVGPVSVGLSVMLCVCFDCTLLKVLATYIRVPLVYCTLLSTTHEYFEFTGARDRMRVSV